MYKIKRLFFLFVIKKCQSKIIPIFIHTFIFIPVLTNPCTSLQKHALVSQKKNKTGWILNRKLQRMEKVFNVQFPCLWSFRKFSTGTLFHVKENFILCSLITACLIRGNGNKSHIIVLESSFNSKLVRNSTINFPYVSYEHFKKSLNSFYLNAKKNIEFIFKKSEE